MRKGSAKRRHTVAAVVWNDVAPFELAVACEVFGVDRSDLGVPWYRFRVCAAEPPPIRTSGGFSLLTAHGIAGIRRADTVVLPARPPRAPSEELLEELRRAHRRGARLLSICTGAFVLAATGLLDGRRATTHWMWSAQLAAQFPAVKVDPFVLYVDEGDVMTSAGTSAGIDLCLHVVRKDFGAEIANAVARRMVVPPHRDGGQAQFVDAPILGTAEPDLFGETLAWMQEHLHEDVHVEDLARRAAMSPRTFARRFRATTGTTPYRWLVRQRVLLAQRLLETTDQPVERIAEECGFGSAAAMRPHFQSIVRTSPAAYRRTFRRVEAV